MNTKEIAQAVKDYLIDLAVNDKLPMDMTCLCTDTLETVIDGTYDYDTPQYVKNAMNYLSDGDLTTEEMVEAINNHEDPNDLIDNVDGVVVWQKVENEFTCDEFLELIGY